MLYGTMCRNEIVNGGVACLLRYIPALQGVVLAHKGLEFLESTGKLKADSPFAIWNIGFEAIVWTPEIGMELGAYTLRFAHSNVGLIASRAHNFSFYRRQDQSLLSGPHFLACAPHIQRVYPTTSYTGRPVGV